MKYLIILLILAIPYAYALTADFDCPDEVTQNVEFTCNLEIFDSEGVYDFKLDLQKNEENIAKLYDPDKSSFQSSFYYLKEFIEAGSEEDVRVIIEESGNLDGLIKLRKEGSTESFNFSIKVLKGEIIEEDNVNLDNSNDEDEETSSNNKKSSNAEGKDNTIKEEAGNFSSIVTGEAILLSDPKESNQELMENEKNLVYESKSSKVVKYLSYVFSLFLIFFVLLLIKKRV